MAAPAILTPHVQRGGQDCGLSALADLLDRPYEEVRDRATRLIPTCLTAGLSTREMLRLLRSLGQTAARSTRPPTEWDAETGLLLVRLGRAHYHWVMVFNGSLVDPATATLYLPEAYLRAHHASTVRYIAL